MKCNVSAEVLHPIGIWHTEQYAYSSLCVKLLVNVI